MNTYTYRGRFYRSYHLSQTCQVRLGAFELQHAFDVLDAT
jgi:hypothetical protein